MTKGASVKVRGADEVQRTLRKLAKDVERMGPVAEQGADLIARSAAGYARVRTGAMRGSIRVESSQSGATVTAGVGIGSVYPMVQEYGSSRRRISANRYMGRAMSSGEPRVVALVDSEVSKAVDRVKGA